MATYTDNFNLKKPSEDDFYNVEDFNGNADIIDKELKNQSDRIEKTESPDFTESKSLENIESGDKLPNLFAKIKKAISSLIEHIKASNPHSGSSPTGHKHAASDITSGAITIPFGGTGATTVQQALKNLGAAASSHNHSASEVTSGTFPIERGGTGATTSAEALSNLGAIGYQRQLTQKDNLDEITNIGTYYYTDNVDDNGAGGVPKNAPSQNPSIVEVVGSTTSDTKRIIQRVTRYGVSGTIFERSLSGKTWRPWRRYAKLEDDGTLSPSITGIQTGSIYATANSSGLISPKNPQIKFATAYSSAPVVVLTVRKSGGDPLNHAAMVTGTTKDGFTFDYRNTNTTSDGANAYIDWIAIGTPA